MKSRIGAGGASRVTQLLRYRFPFWSEPHSAAARVANSDRTLVDILTRCFDQIVLSISDYPFHAPIFIGPEKSLRPHPVSVSSYKSLWHLSSNPHLIFPSAAWPSLPSHHNSHVYLNMPAAASTSCVQFPSTSKALQPTSLLSAFSPRSWLASFGMSACLNRPVPSKLMIEPHQARNSILSVLDDAITVGHLTISDSEGTHYYGKYHKGCNDVHLKVVDDNFWMRILL